MDPLPENSEAGKSFSNALSINMSAAAAEAPEAFVARVEKKKPREVEDAPHLPQAIDFQEELDRREAARILSMHMMPEKKPILEQKHTILWLDLWADLHCGGQLPHHVATLTSVAGNVVWRFFGFCPVCKLQHKPDAAGNGRVWTIAWDTRSPQCVVTCLKTGMRKFMPHPDY